MTTEFEQSGEGDAQALATIRVAAMRESLERIGRFDPDRARRRFLDTFSPDHTFHILQDEARIGLYVLRQDDWGLQLKHLYVCPEHQNKGVGAAVLKRVFSQADQLGCPVKVGALKESDSNRLYVRHGFVFLEQTEFDNHVLRQPA